MEQQELERKVAALELPKDDPRIPGIVCQLIGHSRIVATCFGYVNCARCDEQIGDTLMGITTLNNHVIVGHDCQTCRDNYDKFGWEDKYLVPDPFEKMKPIDIGRSATIVHEGRLEGIEGTVIGADAMERLVTLRFDESCTISVPRDWVEQEEV